MFWRQQRQRTQATLQMQFILKLISYLDGECRHVCVWTHNTYNRPTFSHYEKCISRRNVPKKALDFNPTLTIVCMQEKLEQKSMLVENNINLNFRLKRDKNLAISVHTEVSWKILWNPVNVCVCEQFCIKLHNKRIDLSEKFPPHTCVMSVCLSVLWRTCVGHTQMSSLLVFLEYFGN